ncbi:hypothetical protein Tsp_08327 [Trichinella spiralis]|uniref:hypothetical protein n=1 Tax=Trichinella spiralis TaxID=6334 RepID=UPI0001EFCF1F|nr:hypothetical protein Tsp_08327 [Trichinella spiralis]
MKQCEKATTGNELNPTTAVHFVTNDIEIGNCSNGFFVPFQCLKLNPIKITHHGNKRECVSHTNKKSSSMSHQLCSCNECRLSERATETEGDGKLAYGVWCLFDARPNHAQD